MTATCRLQYLVVGFIVATLIATGPFVGLDLGAKNPPRVEEGNATLTIHEPDRRPLQIDQGRFGTGVYYLRLPEFVGEIESVSGSPRIRYAVSVPGLDIKESARVVIGRTEPGTCVRIPLSARAIPPSALTHETYQARMIVQIQSLSVDREIRNRTIRVVVDP